MPAIFGRKFIPVLMICFMFTDLIIGIHNTVLFTWGSVLIIGLMSIHFKNGISKRILGSLAGAIIFYLISNFGVWILGAYEYSLKGIIECYTLALPFFTHTVISTLVFASVIEVLIKIYYFAKVKIINQ